MILEKKDIVESIKEDIPLKEESDIAISIIDKILNGKYYNKIYSYYEIYNLLPENKTDEKKFQLIILKLANLKFPVFKIIIDYKSIENNESFSFESNDEIYSILQKSPIIDPISGNEIIYNEYKQNIFFYYRVNNFLFEQLRKSI